MHIYLLTHEREFNRRSNSGKLVQAFLGEECSTIAWRRTEPDENLLAAITSGRVAILGPAEKNTDNTDTVNQVTDFDGFVLLDGTWQEAAKMFNKSPYLHDLPQVALSSQQASEFILRANQVEGGLSTAECAIALLREHEREPEAKLLYQQFQQFIRACL